MTAQPSPAPAERGRGPPVRGLCPSWPEVLINGRSLFWELSAHERSGGGRGSRGWGTTRRGRPCRAGVAGSEGPGEPAGGIRSPRGPVRLRRGPRCSQSAEGHCQTPAVRHPLRCLVSRVRVEIPLSPGKAPAQMTQKGLVWSVRALRSVAAGLLWRGKVSCFPTVLRCASACGWQWDTESLLDSSVSRRRGGIVLGKIPFPIFVAYAYKEKHGLYHNKIPETLPLAS